MKKESFLRSSCSTCLSCWNACYIFNQSTKILAAALSSSSWWKKISLPKFTCSKSKSKQINRFCLIKGKNRLITQLRVCSNHTRKFLGGRKATSSTRPIYLKVNKCITTQINMKSLDHSNSNSIATVAVGDAGSGARLKSPRALIAAAARAPAAIRVPAEDCEGGTGGRQATAIISNLLRQHFISHGPWTTSGPWWCRTARGS